MWKNGFKKGLYFLKARMSEGSQCPENAGRQDFVDKI